MRRFGYSSSGIGTLKSLYATAHRFAESTDAAGSPISTVGVLENLNFSNGSGAQLVASQMSIDAYVSQLQGAVEGIIGARQSIGVDASDVIDWWSNIGLPQTSALSVAESAYETFTPAGNVASEGLGNALDAIPMWVKVGGGALLAALLLGQITPLTKMVSGVFKSSPKRRLAGRNRR